MKRKLAHSETKTLTNNIEEMICGDKHAKAALEWLSSRGAKRESLLEFLDSIRPDERYPIPSWLANTRKNMKTAKAFPARIERMADEIEWWNNSNTCGPEFYLQTIINRGTTLQRGVLAAKFRSLPELMRAFAALVELINKSGASRHWGRRGEETLRKVIIVRLTEYVKARTGRPEYEKIADLLTPLGIFVTAEELRQYPRRYKPPKGFYPSPPA